MGSLPTTGEGESEKEEEHSQKVPEAIQISVDQGMNIEALKNIKHGTQDNEMELMNTICTAMGSLPTTGEGEFEKEEEHSQKVPEAIQISVDQGMNIEALKNIKHGTQENEMELINTICAAMGSLPTTGEGESEKEKEHGQKVPEAIQISVDQCMNIEALKNIKHGTQENEMELMNTICAAMGSLPTTGEGESEKEEEHGLKVPEAIEISVDQGTNIEALKNVNHGTEEKEMELVNTVCAAINSLPTTAEDEFKKEEQHSQKATEALNLSMKHEKQQKEMELVKLISAAMGSLPATEEGKLEKMEQHGQKVPEAMDFSVDQGMTSEEAFNLSEHGGDRMPLLDIDILEAKCIMQQEKEQPQKISANDATTFSNNPNEEGDTEEGEISGDLQMDENSFDTSSADSLMLQQRKDEVQKPENSGQIEPRTSDKNGFPSGVDMRISREVINYGDLVDHGSVLETGKTYNRDSRIQEAVDLPASLAYNQVQRGFMEEEATEDHQNAPAVLLSIFSLGMKEAGVNCKKKRGPITEEGKAKKKEKKRKQRAEKNRKLGVKRLKLLPVQKPKTISYCRHYVKGRCYEGDKCKYSHDIVPETKSKPCCHFARHSCMKGDDCPFDHQLSKYPCSNFVTKGSCSRGGACMFSHQTSTKQDIPTSSNDSKPGMKPQLLLGNTKLTRPHNISGSSASQQKRLSDSKEIQSHINSGQQLPDNVHKPPTTTPKGISFINFSNSSLPSPSTPKQGMVTPNKESDVKTGTHVNQGALGTAQNLGENPKKKAAVAPKGINFLSFGRGRVSSSKSPVCSFFNRESGINLSKKYKFGSPELSTSSGRKASVDHSTNEVKAYTSQISTMTSSLLSVSPFVSGQSSERLASGHQKLVFNSSQRALLSTLSFAAQHESDIKMKCSAGASAIKSEAKKHISMNCSVIMALPAEGKKTRGLFAGVLCCAVVHQQHSLGLVFLFSLLAATLQVMQIFMATNKFAAICYNLHHSIISSPPTCFPCKKWIPSIPAVSILGKTNQMSDTC
ncbi:putative transcription factor C3H family [Senna tora]|uniref:Putative transcription factor C3H family n=1 Tax=Senna tora TaxID=362788 RepID=A0A834W2D0_9FABA|nr:putative transcription factor C3H family [Senna tora]